MATPLSIAAYRMASSPSDAAGSRNVIQWLERLQSSMHNAPEPRTFRISAPAQQRPQVASRAPLVSPTTLSASSGPTMQESSSGAAMDTQIHVESQADSDREAVRVGANEALPDDAVPIGLIANLANLSLDHKIASEATQVVDLDGPEEEDVVSLS